LASIPFDGTLLISNLENAIKDTIGVNDVVLKNVRARRDSDPFASSTFLVQNYATIGRLWATNAGYIIPETTSGEQLSDKLTFIAQ
jgi:hypothetical protein